MCRDSATTEHTAQVHTPSDELTKILQIVENLQDKVRSLEKDMSVVKRDNDVLRFRIY